MNMEINIFFGGMTFSFLMTFGLVVYQWVESRRVAKKHEGITDFDRRHKAIYAAWEQKHRIMPYGGSDVSYFVVFFGMFMPMMLCTAVIFVLDWSNFM